MDKSNKINKNIKNETDKNKKEIEKEVLKAVDKAIDKGFAKYPKIFKKVK